MQEILKRRTFAIISHPDAGKTTITEKLLLFSGAIKSAGSIKAKKAATHALSDWMAMEQERGISISSSVMQFKYNDHVINLLDTPGHEDFSEDTYRTLTAVDSALMVIDCAKGVEERTIKLMEVCRLRNTPIISFINKLDREGKNVIDLLDEIEKVLKIKCVPITYPIGMGKDFQGIVHLLENKIYLMATNNNKISDIQIIDNINNPILDKTIKNITKLREEIELIQGITDKFILNDFLTGKQTPVFFGSAINNFGVQNLLDGFIKYAPPPQKRTTNNRVVLPYENKLTGFIFKIQANMDPKHHDRLAFMRIVSGKYKTGIKVLQTSTNKYIKINNALTFMSKSRSLLTHAVAGDIIGINNHGGIKIGDSFTEGEKIKFIGIPHFAPDLFKIAMLKNPLKAKALQKGLNQLCEEGATQVFRPINNNNQILGAIGILQFDVVAHRLKHEYNTDCMFNSTNVAAVRWLKGSVEKIKKLILQASNNIAIDHNNNYVYLAPTMANLQLTINRHPKLQFLTTKEIVD